MSSEDAEDLLHDSVIELFDLSDYSSTLPNDAKERYVAKLNEVQGRLDGVMDTSGQGWLPVIIYVVVNGVGVAFLNVMLEIGVQFQMRC
ncbi:hypothetical protein OUZ56_011032 [Daphnia magna]|uniref:Uncharacterized protein n=1 Tax=Daphnia magna TaxID=35525 RepID=A0ABQ9YZ38_9CRUS|nr:hypothetical protein OUZ56_011032 [Daphnia magna]